MLTVQQLSQELGISVDTLRVWERRYGFPVPQRDRRGHRRYPVDQVELLRVVRQLQFLGYRPNSLFAMSEIERHQLLESYVTDHDAQTGKLETQILSAPLDELEQVLRHHLATVGIKPFILHCTAQVLECLDRSWIAGHLTIAREHGVSDRVQKILLELLDKQPRSPADAPLLLFATMNGERHRLALLMAAVLFSQQGACCQWLLDDVPLSELPALVRVTACQGLALSFSSHYSSLKARTDLVSLRRLLPQSCHIVAGGRGVAKAYPMRGMYLAQRLEDIPTLYQEMFQSTSSL
nr:MerR family transcriptional regulator [uncultured Desulfuromonas sp.]